MFQENDILTTQKEPTIWKLIFINSLNVIAKALNKVFENGCKLLSYLPLFSEMLSSMNNWKRDFLQFIATFVFKTYFPKWLLTPWYLFFPLLIRYPALEYDSAKYYSYSLSFTLHLVHPQIFIYQEMWSVKWKSWNTLSGTTLFPKMWALYQSILLFGFIFHIIHGRCESLWLLSKWLHLSITVTKKNPTQWSTGWNTTSFTQRRHRPRSASIVGARLPWPDGPSGQLTKGNWPACNHLVSQNEGPYPLLTGDRHSSGTIWHTLQQNKGIHIESEMEKDIPIWVDKPSTGWGLCISWWGSVSGPEPYSYVAKWGSKDCKHKLSFPTVTL